MAAAAGAGGGSGAGGGKAAPMFNVTSRFKEAITLINGVAVSKFPLLLARIIGKLDTKSGRIFTPEEETQLQGLLSISAAALHTILDVCSYILEQAAYREASAEALGKHLTAAGVGEAQVGAFQRVWAGEGASLVEKLRARTMGAPMLLHSAKWQMHLQLGQSGLTRSKDSRALFELGLRDASVPEAEGASDEFMVEFTHDQLYEFFTKLERVQMQLDALS